MNGNRRRRSVIVLSFSSVVQQVPTDSGFSRCTDLISNVPYVRPHSVQPKPTGSKRRGDPNAPIGGKRPQEAMREPLNLEG